MGIRAIYDSINSAAVPQTADDFELYRRELLLPSGSDEPPVRVSFLDVQPHEHEQTLLLLHGFAANSAWWRPQLPALAQKNRVIVVDARGNGRSSHTESGNNIEQQVADIAQVLDALDITSPVIAAGHSSGGFVAAELAISHPQRVAKLILVATPFIFKGNNTIRLANLYFSLPDAFFRAGQRIYELDSRGQASILGLKRLFKDSLRHWDGRAKYPQVKQPTLVIEGQRDALFPPESYQQVVQALPKASMVEIGVSKHQVTLERPRAVTRAMQHFINPEPSYRPPWRSENDDIELMPLLATRPWIASYAGSMPAEITVPQVPLTNLLAYAARQSGERPAITTLHPDRRQIQKLTYDELSREVDRFSHALHELGAGKGTRILLLLENMPQLIIAFYAALRLGAVAVIAHPGETEEELIRQAQAGEAVVLITAEEQAPAAQLLQKRSAISRVIFVAPADYAAHEGHRHLKSAEGEAVDPPRPALAGGLRWSEIRQQEATAVESPLQPAADSLAAILFTSGQKRTAVGLTHANLLASTLQNGSWLSFLAHARGSILAAIPWSTAYGLQLGVNTAVYKAARIIIPYSLEPRKLLQQIKEQKPAVVLGTPALYRALNRMADLDRQMPDPPPVFISSGAPLPVEVEEAFQRLSRTWLLEHYGLAEAAYAVCATPLNRDRTGSVGLPLPNIDLQITDRQTGQPLPFGCTGELAIRGPQVSPYLDLEQGVPAAEWLSTGDLAEMDDDGFIRILGRRDDLLVVEGGTIYLRDIEESIIEMPGVDDAAALTAGEEIHLFISPRPGAELTTTAIRAYSRQRLPADHQPAQIEILSQIPRDALGRLSQADF